MARADVGQSFTSRLHLLPHRARNRGNGSTNVLVNPPRTIFFFSSHLMALGCKMVSKNSCQVTTFSFWRLGSWVALCKASVFSNVLFPWYFGREVRLERDGLLRLAAFLLGKETVFAGSIPLALGAFACGRDLWCIRRCQRVLKQNRPLQEHIAPPK